ncbi:MAG: class I SAM-dependent methyltransferase [Burkholderiales bacterium]|nr:class I SAM-dependent methyltransferase [Burkholderiales bacterium]
MPIPTDRCKRGAAIGDGAPFAGETATVYDEWAWLYDETVGPGYSRPQSQLLERVLLPHIPADAELLDLCCGTGLLMQPLAAAGYRVTGLDNSAAMLACARRNAPGATTLLADARHFELPDRFHGVFCTSASLNHIDTADDLAAVFARVHAALHAGGIFVFDLNHPRQMVRWWRGRPLEGEIRDHYAWMITPRYDAASRRGAFRVTIHRSPQRPSIGARLLAPAKRPLYRLLGRPRFIGLRLALLQRFALAEPGWTRQDIDYPVVGHELSAVGAALRTAGFGTVRLETIDGGSAIDEDHSAHFICIKDASR